MIFIGYSLTHGYSIYIMLNIFNTLHIVTSRDIIWLNVTYGSYIQNSKKGGNDFRRKKTEILKHILFL